ncbi:MAG: hypothetical protein Q8P57_04060 [Candidatus Pacearchaeota archaeon]|nr:hypothetical protein [Candidatus Pacearchaeota archaeon]
MENVNINARDLRKLMRDVAQIKEMLIAEKEEKEMEEIELTGWAKNELEEARKRKTKISHEKAREMLFTK